MADRNRELVPWSGDFVVVVVAKHIIVGHLFI